MSLIVLGHKVDLSSAMDLKASEEAKERARDDGASMADADCVPEEAE